MNKSAAVHIVSRDVRLKRALGTRLRQLQHLIVFDDVQDETLPPAVYTNGHGPLPTIVVAPSHDLTTGECTTIAQKGLHVIVLAAVPREHEREAYERAGAYAYLEMDISNRRLVECIDAIAGGTHPAGAV
jgi:DNA-binding NarL/FixJ family response regulator